ncbi:Protein MAIN-LIKE 2 [Glycine soja]|uniref:Protein MAIN-LIKE 2 n=1 Tax=Glycine soja TaxID=3848 RepID=A0A445F6W0_GLYSO|nr:Protein MAIN-LIKE 2 [Glycine soja]
MELNEDPGPIDNYVLYDQDNHVSSAVWVGLERGVLRCHEHTSMLDQWKLTPKQIKLVEKAGFGHLRLLTCDSTIFSTTTGNKVPVMYLSLFEDFDKAGKFAGGAGALAFLYRELGNSSLESQSTTSGCLTLVQIMMYHQRSM